MNTRWKKGQSGNPNGRPKIKDTAAEVIRKAISVKDWEEMAKKQYELALSGDTKAYVALADRAFGKVTQKNEVEDITPPDPRKVFRFQIVNPPACKPESAQK
ncbi:MAG: DUF5681 domain-containing protein [Smithella sp.]|nr:DUF5681 domain-containing protein [Smithella sp.]MDD5673930.1 DUF5681 domain-containing protein [Chitinivibrionales bacterium]